MSVEIRPVRAEEVDAARAVIVEVCLELFGAGPVGFDDMDDVARHYGGDGGIFLVLVDGGRVVGTGAIRRLDGATAELRRMWLLREYRGRGHGARLARMLLDFARGAGYRRVRLDTEPELEGALRLYGKLGFRPIERYNDGPCSLFMELEL